MKSSKKTLLILFGELRTFEYVVPHLSNLDKVDIIISTWSESGLRWSNTPIGDDTIFQINETLITKILPNIKQCHITNPNEIQNINEKSNSWRMYWHWKTAINNIDSSSEYDNVIVHRCDLISNWETILDLEIEEDTLYVHHGNHPHFTDCHWLPITHQNAFWINDYYFFGKFDIVKRFINSFDKENYFIPHLPLWEVLFENNINFKNFILRGFLVMNNNIKYVYDATLKKETLSYGPLSGPA